MKTLRLTLFALVALAVTSTAFAQASLTQTRLSARISSPSSTVFTVSSATGFAAGYVVYIDREAMLTRSVSSTSITVTRGYAGTEAATHLTGAIVWTGPAHYFYFGDPRLGHCTRNEQLVLPWINVLTGDVWYCSEEFGTALGGTWHGVNQTPLFARLPTTHLVLNTSGSSVATYTIRLDDVVVASLSYTGSIEVFLPSPTGLLGKVLIISDQAGLAVGTPSGRTITVRGIIDTATTNTTIEAAYGLVRLMVGLNSASSYYWFRW